MQIHSPTAELRALLSVTTKKVKEERRTLWLGKLTKDHFHTPVMRRAFERITTLARKRFKIVSWKSLLEDPSLDEDFREILAETDESPCLKKSQMKETLETLEEFRKIRVMQSVAERIYMAIEQTSVDAESLLLEVTQEFTKATAAKHQDVSFLRFGKDANSKAITDQICRNETLPRIPTGLGEYDKTNGGFPDTGVVFLAATTSGGKSIVSMNIGLQMFLKQKLSVFRVSLEMQEIQESQRLYSHMTGIPLKKFKHAKLNSEDKRKVRAAEKMLAEHGEKHGIHHTIHCPKGGLSMEETLQLAKPFGYKVIIIDYIGLLNEDSGKEQWKSLMDAARIAKNYTQETGALVILLAQLDDEKEAMRYSKGMKEHADCVIQWNYSKPEQREIREIPMLVSKDRDGETNFMFNMEERFDIMSVYNPGQQPSGSGGGNLEFDDDDADTAGKSKKKKIKGEKAGIKDGKTKKLKGRSSDLDEIKGSGKKKKKLKSKTKSLAFDDGPAALS